MIPWFIALAIQSQNYQWRPDFEEVTRTGFILPNSFSPPEKSVYAAYLALRNFSDTLPEVAKAVAIGDVDSVSAIHIEIAKARASAPGIIRLVKHFEHRIQQLGADSKEVQADLKVIGQRLRSFRLPRPGEAFEPFADVPSTHWAARSLQSLRAKNILQGYPNGTYVNRFHITHEEWREDLALLKKEGFFVDLPSNPNRASASLLVIAAYEVIEATGFILDEQELQSALRSIERDEKFYSTRPMADGYDPGQLFFNALTDMKTWNPTFFRFRRLICEFANEIDMNPAVKTTSVEMLADVDGIRLTLRRLKIPRLGEKAKQGL